MMGKMILLLLGKQKEWRKHLALFVATGLTWAVLFSLYSRTVLGSPLPYYFLKHFLKRRMVDTFAEGIPDSWVATLFSPGRGLFVFSPVLLVIVLLILVLWRHLNFKWTAVVGLAVIAAHWRVIASFRSWWGGASFGPRLFTDVLPWFFLLGMLALAALLAFTSKKNVLFRMTT